MFSKLTPDITFTIGASLIQDGKLHQITIRPWCGVYQAAIAVEGEEVEPWVFERTKDARDVLLQVMCEKYGEAYNLGPVRRKFDL